MRVGRIEGSGSQVRILRAASSIADGRPVDLGDIASGLHRRHLRMLLAALSQAGGSNANRDTDASTEMGDPMPPLVPWSARD